MEQGFFLAVAEGGAGNFKGAGEGMQGFVLEIQLVEEHVVLGALLF